MPREFDKTSDCHYEKSELYLDYEVSELAAEMIQKASSSIMMMGYRFFAHCDEGRDVLLALHELGIRTEREDRDINITMIIDSRSGLAAAAYKPTETSSLKWVAGLADCYPHLKINVYEWQHSGRDSLHSKALVVDKNLTLLRSGDTTIYNERHENTQKENGFLFYGHELAKSVENNIQTLIQNTHIKRVVSSLNNVSPLTIPPKIYSKNVTAHPLRLDPRQGLARIQSQGSKTSMSLDSSQSLAGMTGEQLPKNQSNDEIKWLVNLNSEIFNPKNYIFISELDEWFTNFKQDNTYDGYQDQLLARQYWLDMTLKMEQERHNWSKEFIDVVSSIWRENLTIKKGANILKVVSDQVNAVDPKYLKKYSADDLRDLLIWLTARKVKSIIEKITEKIAENTNPILLQSPQAITQQEKNDIYDETAPKMVAENKPIKLLNQEPFSYFPNPHHSAYKKEFLEELALLSENDTINITVTNINDPDIINGLADACNKGVNVKIAMGRYANHDLENQIGGGGSNSKAMAKLLKLIDEDHKKYFQMRWIVYNNSRCGLQNSLGTEKMKQGTHRKYVSMHHFNDGLEAGESQQKQQVAFVGSSPLDIQAQFYSAELDAVIYDKKEIENADTQLFDPEYRAGIDMHFCFAMDSLKKAGYSHYAQWQYQRYINAIDTTGEEENENQRVNIRQELLEFLDGKEGRHIAKTKAHLENMPIYTVSETIIKTPVETALTQLSLALDAYKKDKRYSSKKYKRLLDELTQKNNVDELVSEVVGRVKVNAGFFASVTKKSFAFHLAKQGFLNEFSGKNDQEILGELNKSKLFSNESRKIYSEKPFGTLFSSKVVEAPETMEPQSTESNQLSLPQ